MQITFKKPFTVSPPYALKSFKNRPGYTQISDGRCRCRAMNRSAATTKSNPVGRPPGHTAKWMRRTRPNWGMSRRRRRRNSPSLSTASLPSPSICGGRVYPETLPPPSPRRASRGGFSISFFSTKGKAPVRPRSCCTAPAVPAAAATSWDAARLDMLLMCRGRPAELEPHWRPRGKKDARNDASGADAAEKEKKNN